MDISCGLILTDGKYVLLGHTTNKKFWDIPKGIKNKEETEIQACLREVKEETGLDLHNYKENFIDLGEFYYTPYKKLHLFKYNVKELPCTKNLKCSSYFIDRFNRSLPEIDGFKYFDYDEVIKYTNNKMQFILNKILNKNYPLEINEKIRRTICYVLRHVNDNNDTIFLDTGFKSIDNIYLEVIKLNPVLSIYNKYDFLNIINNDLENRFEIKDDLIKANYGHSISLNIKQEKKYVVPPDILYQGTLDCFLNSILIEGLKPINRKCVFLSNDKNKAYSYTNKRNNYHFKKEYGITNPVLLEIDSKSAYNDGILFYTETENIFCCDYLPAKYIKVIKNNISRIEIEF